MKKKPAVATPLAKFHEPGSSSGPVFAFGRRPLNLRDFQVMSLVSAAATYETFVTPPKRGKNRNGE